MAASAYGGLLLIEGGEERDLVAVAARDLPAGMALQPQDFTLQPVAVGEPQRYLQQEPAAGTLTRAVGAGELIPAAAISEGAAPQRRLVAVPVEAQRLPPVVDRGALVDVWAGGGGPVLTGVTVVSVGDPREWAGSTATVVLAVAPDGVADLLAATRAGPVDMTGYEAAR